MKINFFYGLRVTLRFIVIIAALLLVEIIIDIVAGREISQYIGKTYLTTAVASCVVSFVCGYLYPIFLKNSITSYTEKYPETSQRYVEEICRDKVRGRYCVILGCICLICSFFYDDEYRLIVNALMCAGLFFFFQFIKYRKQSNIR